MIRRATSRTTLLRLGFDDLEAAEATLATLGPSAEPLLAMLGRTADPDLALATLARLAEAEPDILDADEGSAMRLLLVLGASQALGEHLSRHPGQWRELEDPTLGSTRPPAYHLRAQLLAAVAGKERADALDALRVEYRRLLLRLAARDLAHGVPFDDAGAELSDLACGVLDAALAIARTTVPDSDQVRLAIIAMGKTGGHELNYISDVDVVFVHEGPAEVAFALAAEVIRVCGQHTAEGTIWEVDAALRPEGKAGALSRTLSSMQAYYERWASTWEFQALLKARPAAGDLELGRAFVDSVAPLVWTAAERDGFVEATQAMRRRVIEHIPTRDADRELKLGRGGLRDVEFAVQLLQLVHGRGDEALREPTTLSALAALTRGGYVGLADGETLHDAYCFLRTLEHRIQLYGLRRTHLLPTDEPSLRRLGRSLGYLRDPVARLEQELAAQRREVRRLHEKLFYRPLLTAVAAIPGAEAHLTPEAAGSRLRALGYADPDAALRHLAALTSGVSRKSGIQRHLLPVLLQWFADGPDPDAGLFGFRRISEALGGSSWYLRMLRDEGLVAERLARLLSTSRYATNLLEREPEGVRVLAEDLAPRPAEPLREEMLAAAGRRSSLDKAIRSIRAVRRRELLRIAVGDIEGGDQVTDVGEGLSRLTDATLEASLAIVSAAVLAERGETAAEGAPARLAIIAMGRYGGFELSYASDADVLFVFQAVEGAQSADASAYALKVASEMRRLLGAAGPDPALELDADLRPEGRSGALVRSLESYRAYYARWTEPWEAQALLRADAAVGDEALRRAFTAMIDPIRYPPDGLTDDQVREIRRIKGRVDTERMPRGADPMTHLKLGRGALADIEWTVQLLQLRHAHEVEGLRTPRTLEALLAARDAGLISADGAEILADAWRMVSRIRNAVTLVRGKPSDQLPTDPRERTAVSTLLGYPDGTSSELLNDHLRLTRLASAVVDEVFWEAG
ncbi:bifunctional [glutamine synthetase] adenylyltransferase/[glutamine synthetase]-adenylyl-L-tyrosine phosphorylase [Nocardioides sp. Kera G14]|uniref:bifunctional [glutamine synthetase] adenylyltransferase/[glutamine synthetase]-adenylyl-L-tyrosine phosphorylase n=1 Tax=Nocardioides sp. Kera G14 TaxID=2884264 RepID=UPI001D124FBA|nr:bifunctional [glutamine synthetase] adenylyltransferase/[glutamine synthetase]-adenylyl-L-tyrosine phosphorylase [Nocardioides sp. Kera G14]UDY24934.1 bifunctional [glutamine synthetase] adenylyltransferase/[glutamine synthetase]-adenylyl-L-tyrosine phosphorylase [Nocardioides sp. Kera G14]